MNDYLLHEGFSVNQLYEVSTLLFSSKNSEYYCVKDNHDRCRLLKLMLIPSVGFDNECTVLAGLQHPNLIKKIDQGEIELSNTIFLYSVFNDANGIKLTEYIKKVPLGLSQVINIITGIANGVRYLHNQPNTVLNNNINPESVIIKPSGQAEIPIIINFEKACCENLTNDNCYNDNLFFQAAEVFQGVFLTKSDLYSLGALFYYLLEGIPPWFLDEEDVDKILLHRKEPLYFSRHDIGDIHRIILKALDNDPNNRFASVSHFIEGIYQCSEKYLSTGGTLFQTKVFTPARLHSKDRSKLIGFDAIAGMQDLKNTIQIDIIDALNDKKRYEEYGLSIPNGMLLYGPPGCGKTFFAEKMAEEIGFAFFSIKPSDIQSKWVNASQENIKNLFDEARNNAPSLIFIDELDAIAVSRDNDSASHMNTSVVNELLAQINNCGDDNVFVIGATNRYDAIDRALLRKGRLDKHVYLPPPDYEARKGMFELYLCRRPINENMDYEELAHKTSQFVSSDIKFICDEAARNALQKNRKIHQEDLIEVILAQNKPNKGFI